MGNHRRPVPREELERQRNELLRKLDHDGPKKVEDLVLQEQLKQIDDEIEEYY